MKVVIYSTDTETRNFYIIKSVQLALQGDYRISEALIVDTADLIEHCQKKEVDFLLAIGGAGLMVELVRRAICHVNTSALWTTEDPFELKRNVEVSKLFDFVFTNEETAVPHYGGKAIHLPLAASKIFHDFKPRASQEISSDLFFVGTAWPERVKLLNDLNAALPRHLRKKIGLSGNPHLPGHHLGDLDLLTDFRLSAREFASFANRSAVTLTIDRSFAAKENRSILSMTPPPRLFEIAAAGSAQVYLTGKPDIGKYFEDGRELIVVKTIEEAALKIQNLVADDDFRLAIAGNAHLRAHREHLYEHRINSILDHILAKRFEISEAKNHVLRRVLHVTHNVAGSPPFGGVELYQQNQQENMQDFEFYTLYPDRKEGRLALKKPDGSVDLFGGLIFDEGVIQDPLRDRDFYNILIANKIEIIHYNHLLGHPIALPEIGLALGIPSVIQIHDYYSLCREFTLIGHTGAYCGISSDATTKCDVCLSVRGVAAPGAQTRRRHVLRNSLQGFAAIIHNSEYTKKKFDEIYPDLNVPHHVIGNTPALEVLKRLVKTSPTRRAADDELRVAILGNFTSQKGGEALTQIFWQMKNDPIKFAVIGRVDENMKPGIEAGKFQNVKVVGQYDPISLPEILSEFDVSVHFSIWPETYCISLDEGRAAGLVPIVVGLGALAERVEHNINGIVIPANDPYSLVSELRSLHANRGRLKDLKVDRSGFVNAHGEHFNRMRDIYKSLSNFDYFPESHQPKIDPRTLRLADLGKRYNNRSWKEDAVIWDTVLTPLRPYVVDAERVQSLRVPRVRDASILESVKNHPLFGSSDVYLRVDEVLCTFEQEITIFAETGSNEIVLGARLPVGYAALPVSLLLSQGNSIYEFTLSNTGTLDHPSIEFSVRAKTDWLTGTFKIHYIFLIGGQYFYATAGSRLCFGTSNSVSSSGAVPTLSKTKGRPSLLRRVSALFRKKKVLMVHVDMLDNQGFKIGGQVVRSRSGDNFVILEGWIVPTGKKVPLEVVFAELSSNVNKLVFPVTMSERPDVADHFDEPAFIRSGFKVSLPLRDMPEGKYNFKMAALDYSGNEQSVSVCELFVKS